MRPCWAPLGIVLASCGGDAAPDAAVDAAAEPPELAGILKLHNDVRAMVATPDPLPPLVWSPALAATASAWVAMCRDQLAPSGLIDHNTNRSMGHPYYVGENIFGAGSSPDFGTAEQAVTQWASEKASYDPATHTCNPPGACGHYTQLVWRATVELGCAVRDCTNLAYRTSVVCDYGPGGNQAGQVPY